MRESAWREEPRGETDPESDTRDSPEESTGRKTENNSKGLRSNIPNNIKDCTRRPLVDISWCIIGGESGPKARPMHPDWARSIRDQCQAAGVPFFFKQWGEWVPCFMVEDETQHPQKMLGGTIMSRVGKKTAGRILDGRTWDEYPQGDTP